MTIPSFGSVLTVEETQSIAMKNNTVIHARYSFKDHNLTLNQLITQKLQDREEILIQAILSGKTEKLKELYIKQVLDTKLEKLG